MAKYCVYAKIAIHEYAKDERRAAEIVEKWLKEQEKVTDVEIMAVEKENLNG